MQTALQTIFPSAIFFEPPPTNKKNEITVMLFNKEGDVVCISGNSSGISAIEFTKEHTKNMKKEFVGGGSKKMAEGKIV